jgi:hypothetical protein
MAAIETKRKGGFLATIKKLAKTLNVDWESLA